MRWTILALITCVVAACNSSSEPAFDAFQEYRGLWVAETIDGQPLPWTTASGLHTVYGASLSLAAGGKAGLWRECRDGFGGGGRMVIDDIRWGASEGEINVRWMGSSFGQSGTVNTGTVSGDVLTITRTPLVTATYRFRRVSDDPLASVRLCP